jgi:hypothetical protein
VKGEAENSPEEQCLLAKTTTVASVHLFSHHKGNYIFLESSNDVNVYSSTPVNYAFQVLPLFPTDVTVDLTRGNTSESTDIEMK